MVVVVDPLEFTFGTNVQPGLSKSHSQFGEFALQSGTGERLAGGVVNVCCRDE